MHNYVAAIDFGTNKIVVLVGEKTSFGVKIISYKESPSSGITRGQVVNIQKVLDSIKPAIEQVKEEVETDDYKITEVFVSISGNNIRTESHNVRKERTNPNDLITQEEISQLQKEAYNLPVNEGEQVLHVVPQSYNIDEHIGEIDPIGMSGKDIIGIYQIFIGNSNSISRCKSVLNRANLILKHPVLKPIASARGILTNDERELGVAMLDIGKGTTEVLIYQQNTIKHAAIIPFGSNSICEDIKMECGVSLKHAEALMRQYGSCLSEHTLSTKKIRIRGEKGNAPKEVSLKLLSEVVEARASEIIASALYEINKVNSRLISGIVLTGGVANLMHIKGLIKLITGYDTRIAVPEIIDILSSSSEKSIFRPEASTAVGLILKGFDYLEENPATNTDEQDLFGNPISHTEGGGTNGNTEAKQKKKNKMGSLFSDFFKPDTNNEA